MEATVTVASTTTVKIAGVEPATTSATVSTPQGKLVAGELPHASFESTSPGELSVRWSQPRTVAEGTFRGYRVNWVANDGSAYPGLTGSGGNALVGNDTTGPTRSPVFRPASTR